MLPKLLQCAVKGNSVFSVSSRKLTTKNTIKNTVGKREDTFQLGIKKREVSLMMTKKNNNNKHEVSSATFQA